jgi:hypothetical protein
MCIAFAPILCILTPLPCCFLSDFPQLEAAILEFSPAVLRELYASHGVL